MIQREISMECGARELMKARDAVDALSGVVAAEVITGRSAIRVWQGDELSEQSLGAAVRSSGVRSFQIR